MKKSLYGLVLLASVSVLTDVAWAGCATNRNDGKVYCAAGQGCATNRNDGIVYCGTGQCSTNRNDGKVYCARYPYGGAGTNHNDGMVYCTDGDGYSNLSSDNCALATSRP